MVPEIKGRLKRIFCLVLMCLMTLLSCSRLPNDTPVIGEEGADFITLRYVKWARKPVVCYLGGAGESAPEGFSAPNADQLNKLMNVYNKYYGTYNGVKGILFSAVGIDGLTPATLASDGKVRSADYNRYTFTDEHLAHAVFLPVNDGWDGYYWGDYEGGYYYFLHFSMIEMTVQRRTFASGDRAFTILGGMLPVKN